MGAVQVQQYLGRARDFFKGMEFLKDDLAEYGRSSALLGIHSAISYCDALRSGLGSESVASDDHQRAAQELRSLLVARKRELGEGINRLERLLSQKSEVAYSPKRNSRKDVEAIIQDAQRFALWAEDAGARLGIEGWRND
jgi:hypothetical protein